ncbi:MAG: capsid stabilizing protein [Caudoviricetes sp.]|nr:MAG: capsid stabilizing protein [Caudoviricetes sp.]
MKNFNEQTNSNKTISQLMMDANIVGRHFEGDEKDATYVARQVEKRMINDHAKITSYNPLLPNNKVSYAYKDDVLGSQLSPAQVSAPESVFVADSAAEMRAIVKVLANDDVMFNQTSNGVPNYFSTLYVNKIIPQVYKATQIEKMAPNWQIGVPLVTTDLKFPTMGFNGETQIYDDLSSGGSTSINTNWVPRSISRLFFFRSIFFGIRRGLILIVVFFDYVSRMREAVAINLAQTRNDIGFYGYQGIDGVYGLINDPSLNATIQFPLGVSGSRAWSRKTYIEIIADFFLLYSELATNAAGNIDTTTPMVFGVPTSAWTALYEKQNALGSMNVMTYLRQTFPALEIIQVPNYEASLTGTTTLCQLIVKTFDGIDTVNNIFNSLYYSHGAVRVESSTREKISVGYGGCFVARAMGVSTGSEC